MCWVDPSLIPAAAVGACTLGTRKVGRQKAGGDPRDGWTRYLARLVPNASGAATLGRLLGAVGRFCHTACRTTRVRGAASGGGPRADRSCWLLLANTLDMAGKEAVGVSIFASGASGDAVPTRDRRRVRGRRWSGSMTATTDTATPGSVIGVPRPVIPTGSTGVPMGRTGAV